MWVVLVQLGHSTHEMITGDPLQLSHSQKLHQRIGILGAKIIREEEGWSPNFFFQKTKRILETVK
jgi:hypothetical protein